MPLAAWWPRQRWIAPRATARLRPARATCREISVKKAGDRQAPSWRRLAGCKQLTPSEIALNSGRTLLIYSGRFLRPSLPVPRDQSHQTREHVLVRSDPPRSDLPGSPLGPAPALGLQTDRDRQTDRYFGRKTHSEQLGCCATHLRRHKSAPQRRHHTARPTSPTRPHGRRPPPQ